VKRQAEAQGSTDSLASAGITAQERNVISLLADGCTNRQIADRLALSERTVKTYVSNILQKLHMRRRSQAAAFMARQDPLQ
jgi:two-component system, NarL family, response regulator DevR